MLITEKFYYLSRKIKEWRTNHPSYLAHGEKISPVCVYCGGYNPKCETNLFCKTCSDEFYAVHNEDMLDFDAGKSKELLWIIASKCDTYEEFKKRVMLLALGEDK